MCWNQIDIGIIKYYVMKALCKCNKLKKTSECESIASHPANVRGFDIVG